MELTSHFQAMMFTPPSTYTVLLVQCPLAMGTRLLRCFSGGCAPFLAEKVRRLIYNILIFNDIFT
jgi:hypothetical protein